MFQYQKIMRELALRSPCRKKYAVLILYKGKVIARGFNYIVGNFSVHAEEDAINNIRNKKILGRCSLLLARYREVEGEFVKCHCCPRCERRIMSAGIRQINVLETD